MDDTPGLDVTLLLNIQRRRGDTAEADQLVRAFADRLWETDWPGTVRPRVFFVLVTSANLTEAAFDRNIEIGMLYRDRAFALGVTSHFRVLIDRKLLVPLPPA
jgi:phosphatidylserine/phosphatidylglycerophosphate/cardiolipin synthase-like enzyme